MSAAAASGVLMCRITGAGAWEGRSDEDDDKDRWEFLPVSASSESATDPVGFGELFLGPSPSPAAFALPLPDGDMYPKVRKLRALETRDCFSSQRSVLSTARSFLWSTPYAAAFSTTAVRRLSYVRMAFCKFSYIPCHCCCSVWALSTWHIWMSNGQHR